MRDRGVIGTVLLLVLLAGACGDDDAAPGDTATAGGSTELDLVGGTVFFGTFETGPGVGPGTIEIELNEAGDRLSRLTIDPGLNGFACPNGSTVSGGGFETQGTMALGDDGSFSVSGFSGVFDSSTTAHGTYDLQFDYNCSAVVDWTAASS
ncbi:MAG: hypothetical protein A2135_01870 [Actinobacteria bacterium RBG_16_67_15]|nr:MAG: hypothetical protein A2135_01870 [Actinobacteria bacterium RBG_16_67_15]